MKPLLRLAPLLLAAGVLNAATYTGTVVSVSGDVARVAMNGDVFPSVGTRAEIFFKMAGGDDEILVALGSALKIDQGDLLVKIEEATGTVEKGQLVRFGPAEAAASPAVSPPPSTILSIVGRWTGNEPSGDTITFTFKEDGSVEYLRLKGKKKNILRGKYRTDCAATPCRLELYSFTVNGVRAKGETITGLFELHESDMKFDLSAELQKDPEKGFTKGAIRLIRTQSETPPTRLNPAPSPAVNASPSPTQTLPPSIPFPSASPQSTPNAPVQTEIDPAAVQLANQGLAQYSSGNIAGALASYTEAIRIAPNAGALYLNRANAYLYKPDFRAAIADATKALELKVEKADDAYVVRGAAQAGLGNYGAGIADCNRALKINPRNALAYNNRANNKLRKRNYSGALEDCQKAISLDPNLAVAFYNRGFAHANLGNRSKATADWKKAIAMQPAFGAELSPRIAELEGATRRSR
jgi:Flp pilus assembly protein TadD